MSETTQALPSVLIDEHASGNNKSGEGMSCRTIVALAGVMLMSLVSGTLYGFNVLEEAVMEDTGWSEEAVAGLASAGLVGLFFTLPAGLCMDRWGPVATSTGGTVMTTAGYMLFSIVSADGYWLALVAVSLASFGSGAVFICALSASMIALPDNVGLGVALAGGCFSFSVTVSVIWFEWFFALTSCTEPECWRGLMMATGVVWGVAMALGTTSLLLVTASAGEEDSEPSSGGHFDSDAVLERPLLDVAAVPGGGYDFQAGAPADSKPSTSADSADGGQVGFVQSLLILRHAYFWVLNLGYGVGVGAGVLVLSSATQIWNAYTHGDTEVKADVRWVFLLFPVANTTGNVLTGWITDYLKDKKNIPRGYFQSVAMLIFAMLTLSMGIAIVKSQDPDTPPPTSSEQTWFLAAMVSAGVFFGTNFTMYPALTGEVYGQENFGKYFSFMQFSPTASSMIVPIAATAMRTHLQTLFFFFTLLLIAVCAAFTTTPKPFDPKGRFPPLSEWICPCASTDDSPATRMEDDNDGPTTVSSRP